MAHIHVHKKQITNRIQRIKGQLDAVSEQVNSDDVDCFKTLQTLSACRGALNGLIGELLGEHIREHVMSQKAKPTSKRDRAADELIQLMKTYWK